MNVSSLLVDIGGTDVKFALSNGTNLVPDSILRVAFPQFLDNQKKTYSANEFLTLIKSSIENFMQLENSPDQILISGQVGSWLLTTPQGKTLTDIVSWQTTNTASDETLKMIYGRDFKGVNHPLRQTGNENWEGAPWKVFPDFLNKLSDSSSTVFFHSLISWTVWEITNRNRYLMHDTDASATGMYSMKDETWLGEFQSFDKEVIFPEVSNSIKLAGLYGSTNVKVYIGVGDQQASLLGVGIKENSYVINAGTGGQVAKLLQKYQESPFKVRPYFENQFIETITHIPSGRFIAQFLKEMNVITKCDFQWEIVWKSGFVNPGNREMIGIQDWDFDTFFHNINQGLNPEVLLDEFINLISEKFVEKLKTLGCRKNDSVILAGGVATKLLRLRYLLNQEGFKIIDTESKETTLEGLAKLSAKLD